MSILRPCSVNKINMIAIHELCQKISEDKINFLFNYLIYITYIFLQHL